MRNIIIDIINGFKTMNMMKDDNILISYPSGNVCQNMYQNMFSRLIELPERVSGSKSKRKIKFIPQGYPFEVLTRLIFRTPSPNRIVVLNLFVEPLLA